MSTRSTPGVGNEVIRFADLGMSVYEPGIVAAILQILQ